MSTLRDRRLFSNCFIRQVVLTTVFDASFRFISSQNTSISCKEKIMNFVNRPWKKIVKFVDWTSGEVGCEVCRLFAGGGGQEIRLSATRKKVKIRWSIALKKFSKFVYPSGKNIAQFVNRSWHEKQNLRVSPISWGGKSKNVLCHQFLEK